MKLCLQFKPGVALLTALTEGERCGAVVESLQGLTHALGKQLSTLVNASMATKPKGMRGFSFHWSNAQAKWDVIPANDPTWGLDGAEFILYVHPTALSPLNKPWSLKEMEYVAVTLPAHPGFGSSMRMAQRVVARFLQSHPQLTAGK